MFFYVVFAVALAISRKWSPLICVGSLVAYVGASHAIHTDSAVLNYYARPIVLEFCYGIGAFYLFTWCSVRRERLAKVVGLKWLLLGVVVVGLVVLNVLGKLYPDVPRYPRYLVSGIPAFAIVAGALLLEHIHGLTSNNRVFFVLGEASYIIYLIHPFIVLAVLRVVVTDAHALPAPLIVALIVGLLVLVSGISVGIHLLFEKPVIAFLRARLTHREAVPGAGTGEKLAAAAAHTRR